MSCLRTLFLTSVIGLALLASCSGSNSGGSQPTARGPTATATAITTATAASGSTPTAAESGGEPVFWRTADNFTTVHAGAPYKVVFRITNGFHDDTLVVTANRVAGGQPLEFRGNRVQPAGEEAPGVYYPLNIELPQPGRWELTVMAGNDHVKIVIDAGEPGPTAG